ncbi:ABC transporter permease [Acidisarcina polymorpha]|uniref:ABC transporter permease n=1 Tax=Acidisarcina polymorpha TaxID=2211140 RepID=UPI001F2506E8|nr:FtsX-like permease family protein [Acidisarcina polymorpha]
MRTFLSVFAIAVEVTMILTLVGVSYGTLDSTARRARGVGADIMVRPPGSSIIGLSSAPMPDLLIPMLLKQPHVTLATGTVVQPLAGFDTVTGLDLNSFTKMSGGFHFLEGGPFQKDDDIIVDEYYAREKHLHVGDTVPLINHVWHLSGIFESGKLTRIAVKLPVLQELTGNPNHLSQIYLKVDNPKNAHKVVSALQQKMPGYPIYTMEEFTSLLTVSSVELLRNFIGVVIGVAVIVGFIVVYMAMYTAVLERTREIGILKAMGASAGLILTLLLKETLVLASSGALAGIILTYGTQWCMQHLVPSSLTQETVYAWWPIAGCIAIAGALLGAIVPAMKAINQDVTQALAYE